MNEGLPLTPAQIQTALLCLLSGQGQRHFVPTLGNPQALEDPVAQEFPQARRPDSRQVMEVLWSLVGQGLLYLNYYDRHPSNWRFQLTAAGNTAANDQSVNPDSPDQYLQRLKHSVPDASDTVTQYVNESLVSYRNRSYLASAVMLGVASEAAFLEMAEAFGRWLPPAEGASFLTLLSKPRTSYQAKFEEYRKKLEPRKPDLSEDLADGMALTLDAILDLLRIYRNDAGHPKGKQIPREQAKINLEMFARYLERMYAFKAFFDGPTV